MKVNVINNLPPPSAIYRYANDLATALSPNSELINLLYDPSRWKLENQSNKYAGKFGNHYIVNATFNNIAYGSLVGSLRDSLRGGEFVHYVHESAKPFELPLERCVATLHENPEIRFKTDLYSNDNSSLAEYVNTRFRKWVYNDYKHFHNVLTISEWVKKGLEEYGFSGNIKVIYPPISKEFYTIQDKISLRKKLNLPLDKKLVLSVSTNSKRKNLKMVKETLEKLGNDALLVRVGEDIGFGRTFHNVDGTMLNEIYNACDLLLFPTLAEGYGYPIVEAFSVGLPVVSSDIDVIRETAGDAAILVDPNSVGSVLEGVKCALSSFEELSKKGLNRSSLFSFNKFRQGIQEFYLRLGYKEN